MEKLIELLNEYEKIKEKSEGINVDIGLLREWGVKKQGFGNYDNIDRWEGDDYVGGVATAYMISKEYGFIQRLVENDKIDIKAVCNKEIESGYDIESTTAEESLTDEEWNRFYTDLCLMLLSISDTPIDDLISYLK